MTEMSKKEIRRFLLQGTLTGKLATVKNDGTPHVVPLWFILNDITDKNTSGDINFTTSSMSVKAKNIQHDNRVSICIDDQTPPFSFVTVYGTAKTQQYKPNELVKWATKIAGRYMGRKNAKSYGKRNSAEGELLVRVKPTRIIAEKDIAAWD
ncbi:MAG: PPOX class F420-dependent oxidoreductase [Nitrososphaeraceae archaeon]